MSHADETTTSDAETSAPIIPFASLGLSDSVMKALNDVGYETPSAIQAATIPVLLQGRDVVGLAQTGTGKTAAFALPILSRIDLAQKTPQALVLAPTRELALQVCEAFEKYAAHLHGVHVLPVYGGQGYGVQLSALRRGVHVVVGTPGRIMDHLEKGTLDLTELKYLVLDEADEMLKMGFAEDVETILADTPEDKQVALFSATMPASIRRISKKYLRNPEEITVKTKTTTSSTISQRYLVVAHMQKVDALTRILEVENFEGMIIFVRTKNETEQLAEKLRARGYSAQAINGDVAQVQRERTVEQLKSGALDILVATDVAARGLDVERISHVVNFDVPVDTESYVHRIGRTGRAGRSGAAISFITPRERRLLDAIEKATRQPLTQMHLPTIDDVNATRLTRFDDAITEALSNTELMGVFSDIIGHYVKNHDVPEADVAAALAVVAQGGASLLLTEDDIRPPKFDRESNARGDRAGSRGDRGERADRGPRRREGGPALAPYRIEVGRRHKVEPRQIVGALANEGGLSRDDFGAIKIMPDFSVVELPANLSGETMRRLEKTRVSGRLIELKPDRGPRRTERASAGFKSDRGSWAERNERGAKPERSARAEHNSVGESGAPSDERPARKPRKARD